MEKLKSFPKLEEIQKGIDELLLIDNWDRYKIKSSPKKFNKRLNELFLSRLGILPQILTLTRTEEFPFRLFRLRKFSRNMNLHLISEYSYPPNNYVRFTQRANIPYHPVFYCADHPTTAIFETILNEEGSKHDGYYYLSEWEFKPGGDLRITPFLFDNLAQDSPYKFFSKAANEGLEKMLSREGFNSEEVQGFRSILNYLSHLFIYENTYAVSSFLAHYHLYANHSFRSDVFIYPSWQTEKKAVNFAVHPNTVTEKLKLKRVIRLKIDEFLIKEQKVTVTMDKIGTNEDSIIIWRNLTQKDRDEINSVAQMNDWVKNKK